MEGQSAARSHPPRWLVMAVGCLLLGLWIGVVTVFGTQPAGANADGLTDPVLVVTSGPLPRPTPNTMVIDPVFGTSLRRVSANSQGPSGFETQSYSQLQAFSEDNSLLLLESDRGYIVRRMGDFSLVAGLNSAGWNAPRWYSPQSHTLIHYDSNEDTTLRVELTNVDSGQTSTLYTFPTGYERIRTNRSFDELSRDGRWMGGMASHSNGDQILFATDLSSQNLGATLSLRGLYAGPCAPDPVWGEVEPDWVGVSPLGRYLVVQWERDGTQRSCRSRLDQP